MTEERVEGRARESRWSEAQIFSIVDSLSERGYFVNISDITRVSALCRNMGEVLGMPEHVIEELKTVGLLHDIGKIAIDENILNKTSNLKEDEWKEIMRHPEIGYRILSTVNDMSDMANYVLYHHERWDGKGYPKG